MLNCCYLLSIFVEELDNEFGRLFLLQKRLLHVLGQLVGILDGARPIQCAALDPDNLAGTARSPGASSRHLVQGFGFSTAPKADEASTTTTLFLILLDPKTLFGTVQLLHFFFFFF